MSQILTSAAFAQLQFDNAFTRELPGDPNSSNLSRQVYGACYSQATPLKTAAPQLVAYSQEMLTTLGLTQAQAETEAFVQIFSGNQLLPQMQPYAMCYGGHQFGHWAGQLGDGRAINLGEVLNAQGERWTLQLKGAGPTPYSRRADGLAVLRSSVREFLCSEAMFHLGIPTTRALSLVLTGDQVLRDMFYTGDARYEPGAIVCRVSPSFLRFGNYQIFALRQEQEVLKQLVDYTLKFDFPEFGAPSEAVYLQWFEEVCRRTALLMVDWMRVGFVHGVMNTDNMSILGLTIDYGPYGWLEDFDPSWTPNTTDAMGRRYAYGNQPQMALWNLLMLSQALEPLLDKPEALERGLELYAEIFNTQWQAMTAKKLGLREYTEADQPLIDDLLRLLQREETDMTIFYRQLAQVPLAAEAEEDLLAPLFMAYYAPEGPSADLKQATVAWLRRYAQRVAQDQWLQGERETLMNQTNPKYVLRNYLAQEAIDLAEAGDFSRIHALLDVLRRPYDEQPESAQFAQKRPEWARHKPGCSMLSCSS